MSMFNVGLAVLVSFVLTDDPIKKHVPPVGDPLPMTVEAVTARFVKGGFSEEDAHELAAVALGRDDLRDTSSQCEYYQVTAYYCDGLTRRSTTYYVGTICIEKMLPNCVLPTCAAGERAYYKVKTSAECTPASACVFLEVAGPRTSDIRTICNNIKDCSCWPALSCDSAVCVPVNPQTARPSKCPSCP